MIKVRNGFSSLPRFKNKKKSSEVSRLGYVSLSDRIQGMLKHGKLIADDLASQEEAFDEQPGKWTDPEPSYDPINDIEIDKMEAMEMSENIREKIDETSKNIKAESSARKSKAGTSEPTSKVTVPDNGTDSGQKTDE